MSRSNAGSSHNLTTLNVHLTESSVKQCEEKFIFIFIRRAKCVLISFEWVSVVFWTTSSIDWWPSLSPPPNMNGSGRIFSRQWNELFFVALFCFLSFRLHCCHSNTHHLFASKKCGRMANVWDWKQQQQYSIEISCGLHSRENVCALKL